MTHPTLDTQRLRLRPVSALDALFVFDMVSDPRVRRYLGGPAPVLRRVSQSAGYYAAKPPDRVWIVAERPGRRRVGMVFLTPHKDGEDTELSYQFAPMFWGRGYAMEGCADVLRYALEDLGLARVIAETQAANAPSCRLLQRLGMREFGRVIRFGAEQVLYST